MSLGDFITHLAKVVVELNHEEHHAMEQAAKIVEKEAKAEIGHYQQTNTGPFVPWAELSDRTKDERVKAGYSENEPGLRTGEMGASIDHVVGEREAVVGSNDEKLVWFELGTPSQPPRSVLGIAASRKAAEVAQIIGEDFVSALVGKKVFGGRLPIP